MASRIELPPDHGEEVLPTRRRNFTKRERWLVRKRQGEVCAREGCERPIVDIDHVIEIHLGGDHHISNFEGLCKEHHQLKTSANAPKLAKVNRIIKRRTGERRPRKKIPSRPFQKKEK